MKSDHFLKKAAFSHPNIVPAKKIGAESHGCKLSETKFKALNRLKTKNKLHVVPFKKQKKNVFFRYELKFIQGLKTSASGNRTPVSNVAGCDTHHYTTEDTVPSLCAKIVPYEILKL